MADGASGGSVAAHVLMSIFFFFWLLIAGLLLLVHSILRAVWLALAWLTTSLLTLGRARERPLHLPWHRLDVGDISFPRGFVWGVATAAHQIEGGNFNNNWYQWETTPRDPPPIKGNQKCGDACDHWNRWQEDVGLVKQLGLSSYRMSIEWSRLEPRPGEWDEAAAAHYHAELDALIAAGIEPMLTLLHFSHPIWFSDEGAFERAQNIARFVSFSRRAYREFGSKVKMWCTINEPEVCTANSYVVGIFPPGRLFALKLAGRVLRNLLVAHVAVYNALHEEAESAGRIVEVGIVKDLFQFWPAAWHNPLDHFLAWQCDRLFNGVILDFFRTGKFRYWVPFFAYVAHDDPTAPAANDFVGLNYYSKYLVSVWNFVVEHEMEYKFSGKKAEVWTDMPHVMYPEGLYLALKEMGKLGHPVYVTENGVADADDTRRGLYIRRYLYALSMAIRDGVDVRGYYYWTLCDNFEWCEGRNMRFGLYETNFDTQERTLRPSSRHLAEVVARHRAGELTSSGEGGGVRNGGRLGGAAGEAGLEMATAV